MSKKVLTVLTDSFNIDAAKQVFISAKVKGNWNEDFVLLTVNVASSHVTWFTNNGIKIFECLPLPGEFTETPTLPTTLYRFWLFADFFTQWKNIVYLDTDTMVQADISYLGEVTEFSAVRDSSHHTLHWQLFDDKYKVLRLPQSIRSELIDNFDRKSLQKLSFNAGVLAFNPEYIPQNTFKHICDLYFQYKIVFDQHMLDQAVLNAYFCNHWKQLPLGFNVFVNFSFCNYGSVPIKIVRGCIYHFSGSSPTHKPWNHQNEYFQLWTQAVNGNQDIVQVNSKKNFKKWSKFQMWSHHYLFTIIGRIGTPVRRYWRCIFKPFVRQTIRKYIKRIKKYKRYLV